MDLNYLYFRHQVSLFNVDNAACEESRLAHRSLVAAYARKIEQAKRPPALLEIVAPRAPMSAHAPMTSRSPLSSPSIAR